MTSATFPNPLISARAAYGINDLSRDNAARLTFEFSRDSRPSHYAERRSIAAQSEGKTCEEIGLFFGISKGRVNEVEHKALRKLKYILKKKKIAFSDLIYVEGSDDR